MNVALLDSNPYTLKNHYLKTEYNMHCKLIDS